MPLSADEDTIAEPSDTLTSLPEFCPWVSHINLPSSSSTIVGISSSGRLYSSSTLLASDATSFTYTDDFLIYTTFSHEAKFIPLFQLLNGGGADAVYHTEALKKAAVDTGIKRAVERGSKIVTVVPGSTSLVLQMPRGNLETVFPRPLVLKIVRQDLSQCVHLLPFRNARLIHFEQIPISSCISRLSTTSHRPQRPLRPRSRRVQGSSRRICQPNQGNRLFESVLVGIEGRGRQRHDVPSARRLRHSRSSVCRSLRR